MKSKYKLRPYQEQAIESCFDALLDGTRSMIITLPTGTGKTIMVADIVKKFREVFDRKVLFLAHRRELIKQNYLKVMEYAGLEEYLDIDVEMGVSKFNNQAPVIIGSVQTCCRDNRLQGYTPDVIITDECHCSQAPSYRAIYNRFPDALHIGITATAQRADKKQLYARNLKGDTVDVVDLESSKVRAIEKGEYVFDHHVFDYQLASAINDGWLVNIRQFTSKSDVDISGVHVRVNPEGDRDFVASELNKVLERDEKVVVKRINKAIATWKEADDTRPTVVFCPSVKYAHWAADLWRQAGYTSQAIDATTPQQERDLAIGKINNGEIQVTCNYGVYTHGTDVPKWSSVVFLRPINSRPLYCQCVGRGTRPSDSIAHLLSDTPVSSERLRLIETSDKPDCIVIDVVDVCSKHDICTVPAILGLPAGLDLQGQTLTKAKELIDKFETVKHKVIGTCPASYEELAVKLEEADLLLGSRARSIGSWHVAEDGSYRFTKCAPGFSAHLIKESSSNGVEAWRLRILDTIRSQEVLNTIKTRRKGELKNYFDSASAAVGRKIKEWMAAHPKEIAGTLKRLSAKQISVLSTAGLKHKEIDELPYWQAVSMVGQRVRRYRGG